MDFVQVLGFPNISQKYASKWNDKHKRCEYVCTWCPNQHVFLPHLKRWWKKWVKWMEALNAPYVSQMCSWQHAPNALSPLITDTCVLSANPITNSLNRPKHGPAFSLAGRTCTLPCAYICTIPDILAMPSLLCLVLVMPVVQFVSVSFYLLLFYYHSDFCFLCCSCPCLQILQR